MNGALQVTREQLHECFAKIKDLEVRQQSDYPNKSNKYSLPRSLSQTEALFLFSGHE